MKALDHRGPASMHPAEQELVRQAADALLFCEDLDFDDGARAALADVEALAGHLVAGGRWGDEAAATLVAEVSSCGPVTRVG